MPDIIGFFKNLFGLGEKVTEVVEQKDAQANTPAMQAAKTAGNQQKSDDKIEKAVATSNEDETRKSLG